MSGKFLHLAADAKFLTHFISDPIEHHRCDSYLILLKNEKLSNKATLSLRLLSKCSFTISKLRFFELRKPKIGNDAKSGAF